MFERIATWAHNTYYFNEDRKADGTTDQTLAGDSATLLVVKRVPNFRSQRDVYHLIQGGSPGRILKGLLGLQLSGIIKVTPMSDIPAANLTGALNDREALLRAAFDPSLCDHDSPTTFGVYTFDWYEATNDLTNYATGFIPLRAWCRPESGVEITDRIDDQDSRAFGITLVCFDPRVYEQTEVALSLTPAAPSGALVNRGNSPSPLAAVITMGGAGSATFTITRGATTFILNLSACTAGQAVTVVFENCAPYGKRTILLGTAETFSLKVTPVSPTWMDVAPGSNTFSISNTTNVTSCLLGTYSARS